MFMNHKYDKELISKTYKELKKSIMRKQIAQLKPIKYFQQYGL